MNAKQLKRASAKKYVADIETMIEKYIAATGDVNWTRARVAAWIIDNDLWEQRKESAIKELAKDISRVARTVTFPGDDGVPVRKYHAYQLGHDQPMLWAPMDKISPENMKASINARRDKLVNGAVKAVVDAEYFNNHFNPGDPINVDTDLTHDVNEKRQPSLYEDRPPEDGETPESAGQ